METGKSQDQFASTSERFCRKCGSQISLDAKFCGNCGSTRHGVCRSCGASGLEGSKFCPQCGHTQSMLAVQAVTQYVDPYYKAEFEKFASDPTYTGRFNWAAFFFGAFWALVRGLWLPALLAFVGSLFTMGIVGVVYWFIFAIRGNLMYYKKVTRGENAVF